MEDLNKWGNHILIPINKKINNEETCDNNNSNIINKIKFRKKSD